MQLNRELETELKRVTPELFGLSIASLYAMYFDDHYLEGIPKAELDYYAIVIRRTSSRVRSFGLGVDELVFLMKFHLIYDVLGIVPVFTRRNDDLRKWLG